MAVDMFLKLGDIKGESQDAAHKDEIDVLEWHWGMKQSGTMHTGSGGGSGKVDVQDITLKKWIDKSSPNLMMSCSDGSQYKEAVLTVRKAGKTPLEYVVVTMNNVIVTSVETGGDGDADRLTESLKLNFSSVKFDYQAQKPDGSKDGGAINYGWDIAANTKL